MEERRGPRLLFLILAIEILIAVFFLIVSSGWGTIMSVLILLFLLGGGIFLLSRLGLFSGDWGSSNRNRNQDPYWASHNVQYTSWNPSNPNPAGWNSPPSSPSGSLNFPAGGLNFNIGLGINTGPEHTENVSETYPLPDSTDTLQVDVNNGNLKVVGEAGLREVRLNAVKHVWETDMQKAKQELERLQIRTRQEGNRFIIEAGQSETANTGININLGRVPRIDLDLVVPMEIAANFAATTGQLDLSNLSGEIAARTVAGGLNLGNINGGHDLTIATNSGRITLTQITANVLKARATTGNLDLTAIGAEAVEVDTLAGNIRIRGVNCGRVQAVAQTGSIELADLNCDGSLMVKATAGRINTNNIRANALNIETTTGAIRYQGAAPTAPSQVQTGVGTTELIFAPGANMNLEARSNVGGVQVFLPVAQTYASNRNLFKGQIGAGGPPLNVVSQVGSIRISQG